MVKARMPHGENSSKQTERIDAILERSQAVDELVRLVVEGALVESPFESRYPFGKKGVKWVTSDQVGRRMERMGLERLPEVFAVLAPGLEGHLARTWKWMTSRPHRFRYGFDRPNDEGLNTYYEVWWLRELAKDLTRVEPLAPLELAKVAGFDEVGNHTTDAAADYLASVIAEGGTDGEAILKSLTDAVEGQISGAGITGLVTNALIRSPRREGWAALQHALVHAGAEENVCRTIASNVFEGDDEPGLALTKVIASNGLLKRPSVLEEMNGWVGMLWKPKEVEKCQKVLEKLLQCLEHPAEREAHLKSEDAELMYLGLWCVGREDAAAAVEKAATILREDPSTERRMACLWFLSRMEDDTVASAAIGRAVGDSEVRIACIAIEFLSQGGHSGVDDEQLYKDCDALAPKLGKMPKKVPSLLWPWCIAKPSMASLKRVRPPKPTARVEPEPDEPVVESPGLRDLDTSTIEKLREEAAAEPPDGRLAFWRATLEAVARRYQARVESQHQAILDGTHDSDRNPFPKELQSLQNDIIDEVSVTFPAEMVRMAAEFMASGEKALNECGMIALNRNAKAGRMVGACQRVAREYVRRKQVTTEYGIPYWLKDVLAAPPEDDELWEVLGQVVRREELTTPAPLQLLPAISTQPTGRRIVEALNAWIWENREMMVPNGRDSQGTLLEGYMLRPDWKLQRDEDLARMPLTAELGKWWDARSQDMRDDDGCELARAELLRGDGMASRYLDHSFKDEAKLNSLKPLLGEIHGTEQPLDLHQDWPLDACLAWLRRMHPRSEGESRLMLDAMEKWQLAHERMEFTCPPRMGAWNVLRADGKHFETLTREQGVRLFHALLRFLPKGFVYPGDLVKAHEAGYATDSDLAYAILGGLDPQNRQGLRTVHSILNGHIKQPPTVKVLQKCAAVVTRDQISHAGTIPTPYTKAALDTNGVWGADIAIDLVRALGEAGPERAAHHNNTNPQSVLSHLLKQSRPDASDTPESFRVAAAQADVTKAQLVAMAVFNPRWVSFVEHAMKMSGLAEAVWWLLSHTSGHPLFESAPANQEPKAQITQRTAISLDDLKDGAADVAWFQRVYAALGSDGWAQVTAAAKHASAASGHMRPLLYAAAILGEISLDESEQRILTKRHQDSVRALGIIPLPEEAAAKRIEMRRRYEVLREFRRGTHKFGAERKLNEERAAALSMESLARNAGYDDPIRMEWDLEEDAVREIFERVEKLNKGDLKCELVIEPSGKVTLSVMRAGKELKAPPPELRKDPAFTALKADREGLQARATRARAALEDFMVRGVTFPVTELAMLMRHPLLAPLLGPLVLKCGDISGRASSDGILLTDVMGKGHRLPESGVWKIAHPHDLLPAATWALWQLHCVEQKVVQPFKQVFREFYAVTKGEESSPGSSVRYQGSVVKPPQALALLGQRGWLHSADEGVRKFFREAGIEAGFSFDEYFHVPSEVDSATVREVSFHRMEMGGKVLPLSEVPPVLFSEVMRDLDLMASVAWTGSGEPQFTPSTLEMRAALVNAITTAMKISNIEAEGRYAKIAGKFGEYRVHLGSAVVRKSDSTMIWLEPVKQDTKTPLFLPFADPDPGSAEVVAKVLLLAADDRIKDAALIKKLRDA